jgi:hypothetical protein
VLALVLVLGVAFAAAARADGDPAPRGAVPRIAEAFPSVVYSQGVVELRGTNFSDAVDDVAATVDGIAAVVLECRIDRVVVKLPPEVRKGTARLEVAVAGRRSNAVEVKVLPESERPKPRGDGAVQYETPEAARLAGTRVIELAEPVPVDDRGTFYIQVRGEAKLPDGCIVACQLKLGDELVTGIDVVVKEKRFEGAFGPYEQELFAGNYWVYAVFRIEDQSKKTRDVFKSAFPDPIERAARERAQHRQACRVGNAEQEAQQQREVRAHIANTLARVRRLVRRLETAFAAAGRGAFVREGKCDEAGWEAWLPTRSLKNVPRAEHEARKAEYRRHRGFAGPEGIFLESRWREWMDFGFRPEVLALAKSHYDYRNRYLVIRYGDAMIKVEELFGLLIQLSEARSRQLYELCSLPIAAQDRDVAASVDVIKLFSKTEVTPGGIEQAARKAAKEIALTSEEQAAAEGTLPPEE